MMRYTGDMDQPIMLDLFSCAGGAGMGYHRAGFKVLAVDIDSQPNNPFPFHRGDALSVLRTLIDGGAITFSDGQAYRLTDFTAIHASPPCQGYTALVAVHGNKWPLLIDPVRELLDETRLPYIIENVQGSPVRRDLTLCGEMFGLGVIRHRYFELGNWTMSPPQHQPHKGRVAGWRHGQYYDGPYFAVYVGIDWTSERREIAEAIPPAYTEYIGRHLAYI